MDVWDWLVVIGVLICAAGFWFVYWPAALILTGSALVAWGIAGARAEARTEKVEGG